MNKRKHHTPFYRKKLFLWPVGIVLCLAIAIVIAFRVSPWPGALVIRYVFNKGGHKTLVAMQKALPSYPVTVTKDVAYRQNDKDARLDVYVPNNVRNTTSELPAIVWTHGGGWLSGNKSDDAPYFSRLANQGYIVVALNYSLAPGKTYPYAVHQINDAFTFIVSHATQYHINASKLVLAGDSAGAQLSSQMATIYTNPAYAKLVGTQPAALKPRQIAAVILYCGIYKMDKLTQPNPALPKIIGWGTDVTVWAYTGSHDLSNPVIKQMSAFYHVTKSFPKTFISGGNGDALTNVQSIPFAEELNALGVPVTTLFYPANHQPSLPHEYQFTFNADGEMAFGKMTNFLQTATQ